MSYGQNWLDWSDKGEVLILQVIALSLFLFFPGNCLVDFLGEEGVIYPSHRIILLYSARVGRNEVFLPRFLHFKMIVCANTL